MSPLVPFIVAIITLIGGCIFLTFRFGSTKQASWDRVMGLVLVAVAAFLFTLCGYFIGTGKPANPANCLENGTIYKVVQSFPMRNGVWGLALSDQEDAIRVCSWGGVPPSAGLVKAVNIGQVFRREYELRPYPSPPTPKTD